MPKLPSSLIWLIDRRGRVDGEIKKIEASLARCQSYADDLLKLQELLRSIDQTIALHNIKVNPEYIPTIRSDTVRVNLPHGELKRGILLCLKLNQGVPVRKGEIVSFLTARYADLATEPKRLSKLRGSVGDRLNGLAKEGMVVRYHAPDSNHEGIWGLPNIPPDFP